MEEPKTYEVTISSGDGYEISVIRWLTDEQFLFIKSLDMMFENFSTSITRPKLSVREVER